MRRQTLIAVGFVGALACGDDTDEPCQNIPLPDEPSGDATGDNEAPELIDVEFINPSTLSLTFSEPLDSVALVNPTRFRIARTDITGNSYAYEGGRARCSYFTTIYSDLSGYSTRVLVDGVWSGDPDQLLISLSAPVDPGDCRDVSEGDDQGESALTLHYTAEDIDLEGPVVRDLDGDALAAIGEPWALDGVDCVQTYSYYYYGYTYFDCRNGYSMPGSVPNLDTWLPIPCPEFG